MASPIKALDKSHLLPVGGNKYVDASKASAYVGIVVTPEIATMWLEHNYVNRSLNNGRLAQYARDMKNGRWEINGQPIGFTWDGKDWALHNGQHRCYACIDADTSFVTDIRTGLEPGVGGIDIPQVRTLAHNCQIHGERNATTLAGAARWIWRLRTNTVLRKARATEAEARDIIETNPGVQDSVALYGIHPKRPVSGSLLAALHHEFSRKDEKVAKDFFDRLMDGVGLVSDSPIYQLREMLVIRAQTSSKRPLEEVCALVIKAWNYYRKGRPCRQLKWAINEQFPEIE